MRRIRPLPPGHVTVKQSFLVWGMPKEVHDSAIASLLGQLHLKGKKDWRPYEQASFLHRRHYKDKISISNLVEEVPLKKRGTGHGAFTPADHRNRLGGTVLARL